MHSFEIVHSVLDRYRGLPEKLARITDKCAEWYRSHGREPKTGNPMASGNVSAVTHFMRYCRQFQAAERGAGRMLNNRVYAALDAEFAEDEMPHTTGVDLELEVIDQSCDVHLWLARFDIDKAAKNDLLVFEKECDEAIDAVAKAKSRARVRRRLIDLERANGSKAVTR